MKKFIAFIFFAAAVAFYIKPGKTLDVISDIPENPQKAIVMIHGYGQDGTRMRNAAEQIKNSMSNTAFYFPTAPDRTPRHGYQWFAIPFLSADIYSTETYNKMLSGAVENLDGLHELIDNIHNEQNIAYSDISIVGFSQGGLMAVLTALTFPQQLDKIVSLSGVPFAITPDFNGDLVVSQPDILLIQGTADRIVPPESPEITGKALQQFNISPQIEYIQGMDHQIGAQAMQNMQHFLRTDKDTGHD